MKVKSIEHSGTTYVYFFCPGCDDIHQITDGNGRWEWNGSLDKPTFSPSVLVTYKHPEGYSNENPAPKGWDGPLVEERCHSYVREGRIEYLGDSTHKLAGQTVDIPDHDFTNEGV